MAIPASHAVVRFIDENADDAVIEMFRHPFTGVARGAGLLDAGEAGLIAVAALARNRGMESAQGVHGVSSMIEGRAHFIAMAVVASVFHFPLMAKVAYFVRFARLLVSCRSAGPAFGGFMTARTIPFSVACGATEPEALDMVLMAEPDDAHPLDLVEMKVGRFRMAIARLNDIGDVFGNDNLFTRHPLGMAIHALYIMA